ncbi:unnamed protein product [Larinioides sclopetarius]|uniref:Peptidase S1 domain-containing protein n=1 Tax=Larinioides sclopetarius TaxID=280406 RepID=A0AAV2B709_9ARAC
MNLSMLSFLIVLYALIGVQGKAFPSRYKRNYEGSYHYIPYEEGIVHIPPGYSPENMPNYQDYVHGYIQTNGHDWSAYYQSMLPQSMQHPYSNINGHHKMKTKHNWHFIDQSRVPVSQYTDGMHHFESGVEAPNVIEALVKKDVIDKHDEYEAPFVVEALVSKGRIDNADAEVPVVVDSLTVKEKPTNSKYDRNAPVTKPSAFYYMYEPIDKTIKDGAFISSNKFELPVLADSLNKKGKPVKIKPVSSYGAFELPTFDSLTKKDKPIKVESVTSYDEFELPGVADSLGKKDKPIKIKTVASNGEIELPIVDSLTKKGKPVKVETAAPYSAFNLPLVDSLTKKVEPVASYDAFELPAVVDSLSKKDKPIKVKPVASYEAFELPIVDSLTKNDKPEKVKPVSSYGAFELPAVVDSLSKKDKPIKVKPVASYEAFELPIVDSLTKKDKPEKVKPVASYGAFELPAVDSLGKKDKPIKVKPVASYEAFELPIVDSLTKKDKPEKVKPVASYGAFELPAVVDSLGKKDKPIKVKPVASYEAFELPIVDSLTKKDKPEKVKPVASYGAFELPAVVDSLGKKDKPIKVKPVASYEAFNLSIVDPLTKKNKPVKVEPTDFYNMHEPVKEKPVKEKPVKEKPNSYESLDYPLAFDSLNKIGEREHETPTVIEALVRKEIPTFHREEEHESPIAIEALVRKRPPVNESKKTNPKKILQKDSIHPVEESLLTKENVESFAIPEIEAMIVEQETERKESQKPEVIPFDETHGFNEPEMDGFDENEDGSAIDFDRSRLARSFLPVDSNIFSIATNMQEQKRRKFKKCVTPKNETGNCMPFQLCSMSSTVTNVDELLRNVCIIDEVFIGVCCPEFPVETVRVDWEQLKPDAEKLNEEKSSQFPKECGRLPLRVTDEDPWPWMASLIAKSSDKIFCGGALVTEQYVLTAAHCTVRIPRNRILVRLGRPASENLPEPDFEVIEIKRHAGYNPRTMQNDIALLKLSRRVQFGDFRGVVCLAKDEEGIEDLVSKSASLLRWKETPGEIKDVEPLTVISNKECQSRMRTAIADSILCTEPRTDATMCNADSGAPLIMPKDDKFEVIGILTWNRNDCDERFPAVFTRVSSYHRWIEKLAS